MQAVLSNFEKMFVLGDPPDYEQDAKPVLGARARRLGVEPAALAYDPHARGRGRAMLYFPFLNYAQNDLDAVLEMMEHSQTILGLGDGGAHLGTICDASFTTHMLTHWAEIGAVVESFPWKRW